MLLAGVIVLLTSGCGADSPASVVPETTSAVQSTTTSTNTSTTTSTSEPSEPAEDWVPVGGSEYHDSRSSSDDGGGSTEDHASSRTRDLAERIDAAVASGELHLGAIDRFLTEARQLNEDREDTSLVNQMFELLTAERDRQLADLPSLLADDADIFTAALIDRDFESRVAAFEVLDRIVQADLNREPFSNMIYDLHFILENDVKSELIRRETLASGRIGPKLDPNNLPSLPDRILLVQWSDAFYQSDIVVLVDLSGEPIGYLDHHSMMTPRSVTIADGQVLYGVPMHGVSDDPVEGCVESFVASDRTYLICDDTTSYQDPAWRAEVQIRYPDGSTERIGGAGYAYPEENPNDPVAGHWVEVFPSPDGSAVLGQWSGECEVPSAHMIVGGAVSTGLGNDGDVWAESWALGWRDNSSGLIAITWGACSSAPHQSGVFTVGRDGQIEPLYTATTGGVIARLISPNDPNPIPVVTMPVPEPIDARRYFDDYEVGFVDIGAGRGYLGAKGGDPLVSFVCDDASVYVGPAPPDDLDKLVAVAVGFASQHGCRAMAMAPTECLGIASDPVACNE